MLFPTVQNADKQQLRQDEPPEHATVQISNKTRCKNKFNHGLLEYLQKAFKGLSFLKLTWTHLFPLQ